jgi:anti-anti-sigma regulatory factor
MSSNLKFDVGDVGGGRQLIALSGVIDENAHFDDVVAVLAAGATIDLAGVSRINSTGVREWMSFIAKATAGSRDIVLRRCSVPFVNQISMIAGFTGTARIESVMAPYLCAKCDAVAERLIDVVGTANLRAALEAPLACTRCGATMEFDDLLDQWIAPFAPRE